MQKIKYITNRDLLAEIKVCKATYCTFLSPQYAVYDVIVTGLASITPELLAETINMKAGKLSTKMAVVDPASIVPANVVFRVMTDGHLPPTGDKNKRRESSNGEMIKTNFNPFRHFILQGEELVEVGRSHWRGDFDTGNFSVMHGAINNRLASMFMLLVEQYSRRGNWRGYTYVDEMRSHALVQLSQVGLQFDESRSDNPFAFYTQIIKNCFRRILNLEHRTQQIRDDLLIMAGAMPSYTRQVENEIDQRDSSELSSDKPARRGRKPKIVK
jgi:hypothetical protein